MQTQPGSFDEIAARIRSLGFVVFDQKPYDMTIYGIRAHRRIQGMTTAGSTDWDDLIGVLFKDEHGTPHNIWACGTTDPGRYYLNAPMNNAGTAILIADYQHRGCWRLGKHAGKYDALVNRVKPVRFVRDDNRDAILDIEKLTTTTTTYNQAIGANLHRASSKGVASEIGRYSAGCQVVRHPWKFEQLMSVFKLQPIWRHTDVFSYALLNEWRS